MSSCGLAHNSADLARRNKNEYFKTMSCVAEIESAIEQLPVHQFRELAAWLDEYQVTTNASSKVLDLLDAEEGQGDQWHDPK